MTKYIITSGISMISSYNSDGNYEITNNINRALMFDHIGTAMSICAKINPDTYPYRVKSYEFN